MYSYKRKFVLQHCITFLYCDYKYFDSGAVWLRGSESFDRLNVC
ncbi:hypothetical protein HMPREF3208_00610 [Gardnerella vaginalis]|uniref:Uncharacterized protein n=1 Tax=Gardnerella vaginalis TaxID=2702 RepID=A0A133NYD1_GARVA|nr:hypothetical protein HMPREF3208_00610 [Gardnerella vaginalis]